MKCILIFLSFFTASFLFSQDTLKFDGDSLVEFAKKQLGVTYKFGTSNPGKSFDCSGFVQYIYRSFGVVSPRSSSAYLNLGKQVELNQCKKGDCLVFTGTNSSVRSPGHVGIVIENLEGQIKFIHCSSSRNHYGVVISSLNESYSKRLLQVRSVYD
jgi:cell wall-associated NlpC family hydrolase